MRTYRATAIVDTSYEFERWYCHIAVQTYNDIYVTYHVGIKNYKKGSSFYLRIFSFTLLIKKLLSLRETNYTHIKMKISRKKKQRYDQPTMMSGR